MIESWASLKRFLLQDGSDNPPSGGRNGVRDFNGAKRKNDAHASTTDREAKFYRKGSGKESKLSCMATR